MPNNGFRVDRSVARLIEKQPKEIPLSIVKHSNECVLSGSRGKIIACMKTP